MVRKAIHIIFFVLIGLTYTRATIFVVPSGTDYVLVDGEQMSELQAGDTLLLSADAYPQINFQNLKGKPDNYITILNGNDFVDVYTERNYGIRFQNCRYVRFSGHGQNASLGIRIHGTFGNGISIDNLSSDITVAHCEISYVGFAGIMAKTDPQCDFAAVRDSFEMYNIRVHNNYIHNTGMEGVYIGHSHFSGHTLHCPDGDTIVKPHIIKGVFVYDNYFDSTGLDGIQVSSTIEECEIHDNFVSNDSQRELYAQMSGIIVGGGSNGNCYNNIIVDGKGCGIEIHGFGPMKVYNNLIIRPGLNYLPGQHEHLAKHGIMVGDDLYNPDSASYYIFNNTIVNPKSDGIRFINENSKNNLIFNNVIINPGARVYYDSMNVPGLRSYINMAFGNIQADTLNNKLFKNSLAAFFSDSLRDDYHVEAVSPIIDAGIDAYALIPSKDLDHNPRHTGNAPDCGAYEYQGTMHIPGSNPVNQKIQIHPNPCDGAFECKIPKEYEQMARLILYDKYGRSIAETLLTHPKNHIETEHLQQGIYFYSIFSGAKKCQNGKIAIIHI